MVFLLDPFHRGDQILVRQRCAEIEVITLTATPWGHLAGTTIPTGRMRYSRAISAYEVNGRYRLGGVSADERDAWTDLTGMVGFDRPRGQTIIDLEATVRGRPLRPFGVER